MKSSLLLSAFVLFLGAITLTAQKLEKASVIEFESPYKEIKISANDVELEILLDENTKLKDRKGKEIEAEKITAGTEVNLEYFIQEDNRIAKEIKILTEDDKELTINGLYEQYEDGIAVIDGRKVKLEQGAKLKGTKKVECDCKGMLYLGFKDRLLPLGASMKAKGEIQQDGLFHTKEIEVCKNTYTVEDKELRAAIDGQLGTGKLIVNPISGLANGNISIAGANYKLHNNIDLQGYVNRIGRKVVPEHMENSAERDIKFRFFVIENDVPNAFAYPNGMVFIHTGLLNIIENEAQLVYVLGHEIAHVSHRHGTKKLQEAKKFEKWQMVIDQSLKLPVVRNAVVRYIGASTTSNLSVNALKMGFNLVTNLRPEYLSSLHGKDKERQADRVGLFYMSRAGYDVREAPKFWKKMMEINQQESFKSKLFNDTQNMLLTKVNFQNGLTWQAIAQPIQQLIITKLLETVYSSHPQTRSRYEAANTLISTNYKDEDFSTKKTEADKFMEAMLLIKKD